jgi:hypothetical protein
VLASNEDPIFFTLNQCRPLGDEIRCIAIVLAASACSKMFHVNEKLLAKCAETMFPIWVPIWPEFLPKPVVPPKAANSHQLP